MITTKDLLDSLNLQDVCPKCGVSWKSVEEFLNEPLGDNREIAKRVIANCPVCQMRFGEVN